MNFVCYNIRFELMIEGNDKSVVKDAIKRIYDAVYADPKCKAMVTDRETGKIKEWDLSTDLDGLDRTKL